MGEHVITYEQIQRKVIKKTVKLRLSHCPFCGGEAEYRIGGNWNPKLERRMGVGVRCKDCGALTPVRQSDDAHIRATELWNKRASE